MTNDTLLPVPDYTEYQDQAYELDRLTQRLDLLVAALQVRGVYNAANKQLARLLDENNENKMIPITDWAGFSERGGLKGAVDFLPTKDIADTTNALFQARDQVKKDLYEITGLADVIRGSSDPRETAQAVATKGRFGSLRLQDRQAEVARYCRDNIRMMGEIISEHYPDETLIDVSGIMYDEGIGPMMPTPPKPPDSTGQPPPPMIGHNGGPPMNGVSGPGPMPQGTFALGMTPIAPSASGSALGAGPISPSQGSQPPGVGAAPFPGASPPGMAPPAIPPQLQYALAIQTYEQKRAAVEVERQTLIQRAIALLRQDKLRGFRIDIETDSTVADDANEEKGKRVEFITSISGFLEKAIAAAQTYPEIVPLLGKMILFAVRGFRVGRDLESSIEEFIDKAEKDIKRQEGQPKPPDPKVQAEQIKAQAEIEKSKLDTQSAQADHQSDMAMKQLEMKIAQDKATLETQHMQMEAQFKERELQLKTQEAELKMRLTEHETNAKLAMAEREGSLKMQMMERQHAQGLEAGEIAHKRGLEAGEVAHKQKLESFNMAPKPNGALT